MFLVVKLQTIISFSLRLPLLSTIFIMWDNDIDITIFWEIIEVVIYRIALNSTLPLKYNIKKMTIKMK